MYVYHSQNFTLIDGLTTRDLFGVPFAKNPYPTQYKPEIQHVALRAPSTFDQQMRDVFHVNMISIHVHTRSQLVLILCV